MTDFYEVKNWVDLQHYTKRNPPWIKLYRRLLKEGDFQMLTETEQWQLVRLWLVSAEEHPGGWIPNDQRWLRVMTGSTKPLPLKKLEKLGWLVARDASAHASAAASTDASALLDTEEQRFRDLENPRPLGGNEDERPLRAAEEDPNGPVGGAGEDHGSVIHLERAQHHPLDEAEVLLVRTVVQEQFGA